MGEHRHGQANTAARQQLQAAQLVAGAADRDGLVQRIDAHHLELAQHGGAVEGDRRADAGNDRVEALELLAPITHLGPVRGDIDVDAQRVDDLDLVPAVFGRFDQAFVRVQFRIAGEHGDLHAAFSFGFFLRTRVPADSLNEEPGSMTKRFRNASRPSNMRKLISSRLVSVISIGHWRSPICRSVSMT